MSLRVLKDCFLFFSVEPSWGQRLPSPAINQFFFINHLAGETHLQSPASLSSVIRRNNKTTHQRAIEQRSCLIKPFWHNKTVFKRPLYPSQRLKKRRNTSSAKLFPDFPSFFPPSCCTLLPHHSTHRAAERLGLEGLGDHRDTPHSWRSDSGWRPPGKSPEEGGYLVKTDVKQVSLLESKNMQPRVLSSLKA